MSTALSFRNKKQFYITSRSEHHHNTNNAYSKILHHHNLGEEPQANHRELRRRRQRCATPKSRPAASLSSNSNSSTEGLSLTSRTHTIVDHPAPAKLQQNTLVTAPMETTDLGHSAWGPRLIQRLTLRYLKPLQEHHLRQPKPRSPQHLARQSRHPAPKGSCAPPRQHERGTPPQPLRSSYTTKQPPITLSQAATGLGKRHLQEGRDADGATTASVGADCSPDTN
jgi:hypothetical protein